MNNKLPDIRTAKVAGKTVFLLGDLDAPLANTKEGEIIIEDDMRLKACMPTVEFLLGENATVILAGKIGRPGGRVVKELSLEPVAKWFSEKFEFRKIGGFGGWQIGENLFLLENLRFNPGEEKNDEQFAKELASLVDVYVNDAFSLSHRAHASVVGVASLLPHFAGIHLQREVGALTEVLENPLRPLVVIIGGKKIETKLPLIGKMLEIADYVLVGGKLAQEALPLQQNRKPPFQNTFTKAKLIIAHANPERSDVDVKSLESFLEIIPSAKTIVWNGPMGAIQSQSSRLQLLSQSDGGQAKLKTQNFKDAESGTRELAKAIAESKAYTVVGGGDTVEYLHRQRMLESFGFVSTGGGAMLVLLSGDKLPGLQALL